MKCKKFILQNTHKGAIFFIGQLGNQYSLLKSMSFTISTTFKKIKLVLTYCNSLKEIQLKKKQIYTSWDMAVDALDDIDNKIRRELRQQTLENFGG